ncbi:MAG: class D sortase [Halieaceae bacterium]
MKPRLNFSAKGSSRVAEGSSRVAEGSLRFAEGSLKLAEGSLRFAEGSCFALGLLLSGFFLTQMVQGEVSRVQDIESIELAWVEAQPDQSLWSEERISAWQATRTSAAADVLAVLALPDLGLKVPVYGSASDLDMDRGAGWIQGTAAPGDVGNIGIAGHRDGYFRVLKDAEIGDALSLQTAAGEQRYVIDEILIVDPLDVEVLDPSDQQRITLVTCYPFYFVGSAPQRYVVKAQLDETLVIN